LQLSQLAATIELLTILCIVARLRARGKKQTALILGKNGARTRRSVKARREQKEYAPIENYTVQVALT
jgi:hypothetical protein